MQFKRKLLASCISAMAFMPIANADDALDKELAAAMADTSEISLDEIVVTAQRREEKLQEVPVAVTAIGSKAIHDKNINSVADIKGMAPSLSIGEFAFDSDTLLFYIRGVGSADAQLSNDPAVGLYYDDVYIGRTMGIASDTASIERIEVLRGPQGTLYGRNTTGGAINIVPEKPSEDFGFKQKFSAGNFGLMSSHTQVDTGRHGGLAIKGSYITSEKEGFVEFNDSNKNYGDSNKDAGRIALNYWATDKLTFDYAYDFSKIKSMPQYYQLLSVYPDARNTFLSQGYPQMIVDGVIMPEANAVATNKRLEKGRNNSGMYENETKTEGHTFKAFYEINDGLAFKSITGFRKLDNDVNEDFSGLAPSFMGNEIQINGLSQQEAESKQFSQEFQLLGRNTGNGHEYTVGLYYFSEDGYYYGYGDRGRDNNGNLIILANEKLDTDNESYAVYGQYTMPVYSTSNGMFRLTLGGRYTVDKRGADKQFLPTIFNGGTTNYNASEAKFTNFNPSITLGYLDNDGTFAYGKIATGYKSGGFSTRGSVASMDKPYNEENLISYEIGTKSQFANNRIRINTAVFYNDYEDMQVDQVLDFTKPFETDTFNAGKASIAGLELDAAFLITESLVFDISYTYLDADFDEVEDYAGIYGPVGGNAKDSFAVPYAPKHALYTSLNYKVASFNFGDLGMGVNYQWRDEQCVVNTCEAQGQEATKLEARGLIGARIALSQIPLGGEVKGELALWGENLADEEYLNYSVNGFSAGPTGFFGEPRTFGLDFTVEM